MQPQTLIPIALLSFLALAGADPKAETMTRKNVSQFSKLIMWADDEVSSKEISKQIEKDLQDKSKFMPEGKFYKVLGDFDVFGFKAKFVGTNGYDVIVGPNAIVLATPKELMERLRKIYDVKFEQVDGGYLEGGFRANFKGKMFIFVHDYPDIKGTSIIVGAPSKQN